MPNPEKLAYSIKEVCELTTLSRSSVYNHIASGRLRAVRIAGRRVIPAEALHALLSDGE